MKTMRHIPFLAIIAVLLAGCAGAPETTLPPTSSPPVPTDTLPVTPTEIPATPNLPSPTPPAECVTVYYENNAQIELVGPSGTRILIDIYEPALLSSPATASDTLLTTHTHWDHINAEFQQDFPGQQIMTSASSLQLPDASIQGIPSAHNSGDTLKAEGGTNYIYLIEMGGLRIAHFGDIGQDALTSEQLATLGSVDIAFSQLANSYSDMDAANEKGFKLMEQLAPRLLIPTHLNLDTAKMASTRWQGYYSDASSVYICKPELSETTQILFLGEWAKKFGERLQLSKVDW